MAVVPIQVQTVHTVTSGVSTLSFTAFTPQVGELYTILAGGENNSSFVTTLPSGGPTFARSASKGPADTAGTECAGDLYTVIETTATSRTIVITQPGGAQRWSGVLIRWPVGCTLGNVLTPVIASSTAETTFTTGTNMSEIFWADFDFNAQSSSTVTYWQATGTVTQEYIDDESGLAAYTAYYAIQNANTAGTQDIGMSLPVSQHATFLACEIKPPPVPELVMAPRIAR